MTEDEIERPTLNIEHRTQNAIISGRFNYQETDGEGTTYITVVGDFVSAVLAYSVVSAYFVAYCVAFVDSISCCGYCRRGVSFPD